jgi:surface carbohydrate biosynthesis protein
MADQAATLIIPVENQVRELDAKLLAERGFPVILGSRTYVHFAADSMPRGVYLAKSMRSLSDRMFTILRKLGHEIVAFDEEGLVRPSDARYYARRMSEVTVQQVSALLAWGPDNAATFERFPAARGVPIHVTGNPRVDMLRPEVRSFYAELAGRIRKRFGRFILLNSNFGLLNHYIPRLRLDAPGGEPLDEYSAALAVHRKLIYEHFRKMIPELAAAFPEHTILIRPHPIETHEPWLELASGHPNIVVDNDGSVVPWLMACEVLVQNGCQTAIEGALVGTPVVSFRPATHELDIELIESLSHQAVDLGALLEIVRSILAGELGAHEHPDRERDLARHIAALDGPLASERIVDVLEKAGHGTRPPPRTSAARRLDGWVHNRLRTASKRINMGRREHRSSQDYHDHRFPDVSLDEIRERIARLGQQLGRFEDLRVRQRSKHLFQIDA